MGHNPLGSLHSKPARRSSGHGDGSRRYRRSCRKSRDHQVSESSIGWKATTELGGVPGPVDSRAARNFSPGTAPGAFGVSEGVTTQVSGDEWGGRRDLGSDRGGVGSVTLSDNGLRVFVEAVGNASLDPVALARAGIVRSHPAASVGTRAHRDDHEMRSLPSWLQRCWPCPSNGWERCSGCTPPTGTTKHRAGRGHFGGPPTRR